MFFDILALLGVFALLDLFIERITSKGLSERIFDYFRSRRKTTRFERRS